MAKPRSAAPGDVVLIHFREQPASFARIEEIRPHERPGWFYCDLLVLAVPTQPITWILQRHQIDGAAFTMGGEGVRIERLPDLGRAHGRTAPEEGAEDRPEHPKRRARSPRAKVVALFPRGGSEADGT